MYDLPIQEKEIIGRKTLSQHGINYEQKTSQISLALIYRGGKIPGCLTIS